ncbi:MAG: carotenoid 1,2-hydratase [Burkholderiaceae bacterium]
MSAAVRLRPGFDRMVPRNGYAWWYLDAFSDDGEHGLTLIAFIGSVFSPYYAWARRHGPVDPLEHCAFNVALYGKAHNLWAMTERSRSAVRRSQSSLMIGPSSIENDAGSLSIQVNESTFPRPGRIAGRVRIEPEVSIDDSYALDGSGKHVWQPLAPRARVEVAFDRPAIRWSGTGYVDTNAGDEPIEDAFSDWQWSRAHLDDGSTAVTYDVARRQGSALRLALKFDADGSIRSFEPPPAVEVGRTGWRLDRSAHSERRDRTTVVRTLEDAPFYARSILGTQLLGARALVMHERLALDRFRSLWVQCLLPFRMPRVRGA